MGWLALLRLLLSLASSVAGIVRDKQLIGAGEARAVTAYLENSLDLMEKADAARDKAERAPVDADGDGVPDDDGYRRD